MSSSSIRPLFIFSLPRSGSTFLQRILATQKEIATTAEPWILLPYFYTLKKGNSFADYAHFGAVNAIHDFYNELPNGVDDYLQEIGEVVKRLYAMAAGEGTYKYFLDKTPRYHLIIDEIMDSFPDGKFIFLWRNPLSIVSSIIQTFGQEKWILYRFNVDLFNGIENLTNAYEKYSDRAISLQYEAILKDTYSECYRLFDYLELTPNIKALSDFSKVEFSGRYGDRIGIKDYQMISREPLEKWKNVLANPIRKHWCQNYLSWIGEKRLELMGYDLHELVAELKVVPQTYRYTFSDIFHILYGGVFRIFDPHIFKQKLKNAKSWHDINASM